MPAPIGALIATNFDYKSLILIFINIVIVFTIYFPFFKIYDKIILKDEIKDLEKI